MESISLSTTSSAANQWIFHSSAFPVNLVSAVKAILENVADEIEEVRVIERNKCPWALYRSKSGHRCAQFIARRKFSGFHFNVLHDGAILTDLATGEEHTTNGCCCSCDEYSNWCGDFNEKCEHMIALDKHMAELAPAEPLPPAPAEPEQRVKIDLNDVPPDSELIEAENWDRTGNQQFFVRVPQKTPRTIFKKIIGRISESFTGSEILAYTSDQIVGGQSFSTTYDAVAFVMRSFGLKPFPNWKLMPLEQDERFSPDTDEDLDYLLQPGDRGPINKPKSDDDDDVDEDGCIPW
jgi:hypothetical protein